MAAVGSRPSAAAGSARTAMADLRRRLDRIERQIPLPDQTEFAELVRAATMAELVALRRIGERVDGDDLFADPEALAIAAMVRARQAAGTRARDQRPELVNVSLPGGGGRLVQKFRHPVTGADLYTAGDEALLAEARRDF